MKEKPILFSTSMVKAILEGRKTMTRRIPRNYDKILTWHEDAQNIGIPAGGQIQSVEDIFRNKRPYSEGDILWVRETWCEVEIDGNYASPCYQGKFYYYKADDNGIEACRAFDRWRPSIFMPRKAARLFLEVLSVRVERLQKITEADAIKEGLPESITGASDYTVGCFRHLWDSLNAERGYGWESNPWVWVIEFRRNG